MRYFILLNIFIVQFCYGQTNLCDSLFNRFKNDLLMESVTGDLVRWDDETKVSYYTLMMNCPNETLIKYTDDSFPAIRCIIYTGLMRDILDTGLLSKIALKHKNDTAQYTQASSDVTLKWKVNEFMQSFSQYYNKLFDTIYYSNKKSDTMHYYSLIERIKNSAQIIIPGLYHGIVSKDSLLNMDSLKCSIKEWKIDSFTLIKTGDKLEYITTNNFFDDKVKAFIKSMKSGAVLIIDEIKTVLIDNYRRKLPPLILKIK